MALPAASWVILRRLRVVLITVASASFLFSFIRTLLFIHSKDFDIIQDDSCNVLDIFAALFIEYVTDINAVFILLCLPTIVRAHPPTVRNRRILAAVYFSVYLGLFGFSLSRFDTLAYFPAPSIMNVFPRSNELLTRIVREVEWQRSNIWIVCFVASMYLKRKERAEADAAEALLAVHQEKEMKSEKIEDAASYPLDTKIRVEEESQSSLLQV